MSKLENVVSVDVDSTARAWIKTKGDAKPDKEVLEKAMRRHRVTNLKLVTRTVPVAEFIVTLEGMS